MSDVNQPEPDGDGGVRTAMVAMAEAKVRANEEGEGPVCHWTLACLHPAIAFNTSKVLGMLPVCACHLDGTDPDPNAAADAAARFPCPAR